MKEHHRISPSTPKNRGKPTRGNSWLSQAAALLALTLVAYLPATHGGFIWDDDDYVTNNPLITAPDGLGRIWFSLDSPSQYFPLVYSVFRVEHWLWGFNPAGYHWVNIVLHAANALLLGQFLKRLRLPGGWLAAAIFALHPVQVESVAWVTELKNVLSLFFFLLTLLAWIAFIKEPNKQRWRFYAAALIFFALALFSKTTVVTLPAVLLLILWLKRKPMTRERLLETVPFVVLSIGMGLVTMWWERYHQGTRGQAFSIPPMARVLIASRALWFYVGKLLWPAPLIFSYPRWHIQPNHILAYGWLALCAGAGAAIFYLRRFAGRSIEVAALFFAISLAPLLGFVMLYTFRYSFVADHYQYIASIGPIGLAAAGIGILFRKFNSAGRFALSVGCGMLLILLGGLTWRQCGMYADAQTLWSTTLERNPSSALAHDNLGVILFSKGKVDEAIGHYRAALALLPNDSETHNNLGNALLKNGQIDEAMTQYEQALESDPHGTVARFNLGEALLQKGRLNEAVVQYRSILTTDPDYLPGWYQLGCAFLAAGRLEDASDSFKKALAINPHYDEAHNSLGNVLLQQGRLEDAIAEFQKAVDENSRNAGAHFNLANALSQNGRADEAIAHYQKALENDPGNANAHLNLATTYLLGGKLNEAIAQFQLGLAQKPDDVGAHYNLGMAFLKANRKNEAVGQFQEALRWKPDYEPARGQLNRLAPGEK